MNIYLKWYYWYKNRWDELLLLWLIDWLWKNYKYNILYIESGNKEWLNKRLYNCKKSVKLTHVDKIICVERGENILWKKNMLYVFWWGEVFTDARPFPYNGWNYLLGFWKIIRKKNFIILGWLGTEKNIGTNFLYKQLIGRAKKVRIRDKWSYAIAEKYISSNKIFLEKDFAYDVLDFLQKGKYLFSKNKETISSKKQKKEETKKKNYIIININKYLRNKEVVDTCRQIVKSYPNAVYIYFPAAIGSDDLLFGDVKKIIPGLKFYNRTEKGLLENISFLKNAKFVLAARLHVLLVAQYFDVPFNAVIYQEKIKKIILDKTFNYSELP